jgi:hypothetical protein
MARELVFQLGGADYSAAPVKLDRKKLYGWSQTEVTDDSGAPCRMVSVDETGTLIIDKGGLGMGILGPAGQWVDRSTLRTVDADGNDVAPVPSSFDAPVSLAQKVEPEDFLDHSITAVYELPGNELAGAIGEDIYTFRYNFREGYSDSPAFLMAADGVAFMLVGYKNDFEFLGLDEASFVAEDDETEDEESDDLDFSMF